MVFIVYFFPLWSSQINTPSDNYHEIMQMLHDHKNEMCMQMDKGLDVLFQSLIFLDPYVDLSRSRKVKKEYKQLKREFVLIAKVLKKLKRK